MKRVRQLTKKKIEEMANNQPLTDAFFLGVNEGKLDAVSLLKKALKVLEEDDDEYWLKINEDEE